jgi:hypothetical protein
MENCGVHRVVISRSTEDRWVVTRYEVHEIGVSFYFIPANQKRGANSVLRYGLKSWRAR